MKRKIAIILSICGLSAAAQNQNDIFRFSNQNIVGSVRTLGLAGAWGAAGADLSAASNNPAGLALYRRNEMMGSIAVTANNSKTNYNGGLMSDGRTQFNIPNLGVVYSIDNRSMAGTKTTGVTSGSFAFGMNRINDYQMNTQFAGTAKNTTVGNYLAAQANGYDSGGFFNSNNDNYLHALAWRVSLIDNNGASNKYASILDRMGDTNYAVNHFQQIQTRGRMNEWYAGGGLNVGNVLYLGATLVIQHTEYSSENTFSEKVLSSSVLNNPYRNCRITQSMQTAGTGVGGKFGLILRPTNFLRVGVAYHTPIRFNMTDHYQNSIAMNYNGVVYTQPSEGRKDYYKYQIITPEKLMASASLIVGKLMILNVDVENVDYTKGRLQSIDGQTDFADANQRNGAEYGKAQNYKAGIEVCGKYTRFRAGYAYLGSPFNENVVSKSFGSKQLLTAGFGWIYDNTYFVDLAVTDRIGKDFITPYEGVPTSAVNTSNKYNFMIGAGMRF